MSKPTRDGKPAPADTAKADARPATSLLQAVSIILVATGLFLALLEGGLTLLGVQPELRKEDPFVGFAGNVPLFVESALPNGQVVMSTSPNKLTYFNHQVFPRIKAAGTYRIFSLGGSTTYGRPYNDLTSFSGWLRELLPQADGERNWEVINAGGISYASYRVARLMEELVQYQPDLFIVYTGQNEFLEERTYGALRDLPEVVRTAVGVLARTRTWSAMNTTLERLGVVAENAQPERVQLAAEVDAILDRSSGLQKYRRDDVLREGILEHYRDSLERMTGIARRAGAQIIFVTPASNLKDFSPFKSEHSAGLDETGQQHSQKLLEAAARSMQNADWAAALSRLDEALAGDPRYAELHYRRGRVLFALGRFDEALAAFELARDEDVCPLRALTPMRQIVTDVARAQDVPLVDYVALVEGQVLAEEGHRIAGEGAFLDHVHPTVTGHRLLATALVESLVDQGVVRPGAAWPEAAIAAASRRVESRIDPYLQAKSLLNLTKVLSWASKYDDARRSARQALSAARGYPQIAAEASTLLLNLAWEGEDQTAVERYTREALAADPWNPQNHHQLGTRLLRQARGQAGAAHILLASALRNNTEQTNTLLGMTLYQNGRQELAYPYLSEALRANPADTIARQTLAKLRQQLGPAAEQLPLPEIVVRRNSSGAPHEVFMKMPGPSASDLPDGFFTEWYENGNLKRYADYRQGALRGVVMHWDQDGRLQARSAQTGH